MRILFVSQAASIHTARWINQLAETGWDIHLFDVVDNPNISQELRDIVLYRGWYAPPPQSVILKTRWPFSHGSKFMTAYLPKLANFIVPSKADQLAKIIEKLRPDCIHAMSMTHSVFPLVDALKKAPNFAETPWIYSSWGSDLYYFAHQKENLTRVKNILSECKYYIADCHRDVELARSLGFRGEVLGIFPTGGGYNLEQMRRFRRPGKISERRTIVVKGYENFAGRALIALEALELCAELLTDYKIIVFSPHPPVVEKIHSMVTGFQLPIEMVRGRFNPHEQIWQLFGQARISIGISLSDGSPNTLLEAMIMGAFPIQTDPGGATTEWIEHGISGLTVPPDDPEAIAAAIRQAISNDQLVDNADTINSQRVSQRLDMYPIRKHVITLYKQLVPNKI